MLSLMLMWTNANTKQCWCIISKKETLWVKDGRRRRRRRRRPILAPRAVPPRATGSQKCTRKEILNFGLAIEGFESMKSKENFFSFNHLQNVWLLNDQIIYPILTKSKGTHKKENFWNIFPMIKPYRFC